MKKVAVVGVYGTGPDFTTGQAVKCHTLIDWFREKYGTDNVIVVNTYKWKNNPIQLIWNLLNAFSLCRNIIIMPAQHGIKVFAPLVYYLNLIYKRSIYYIVIGGWLAEMLKDDAALRKYISLFDGVHVEAKSMKQALELLGLRNVYYMPNSRRVMKIEKKKDDNDNLRICTYSRVTKTKGIEDAILICEKANNLIGHDVFKIDIFGKIDDEYAQEFEALIHRYSKFASYQGCKNADETIRVLNNYFALLFPTYYEGEGFAGTVLDAFVAQIPIVANDWKYNSEIITNGVDGFIYPCRNIDSAACILVKLYKDKNLYSRIQQGCRESALKYSTDKVMEDFSKLLC